MPEKNTHGGKRKGSGKKPLPYRTKTVRIPVPVLDEVEKIVTKFKMNNGNKN